MSTPERVLLHRRAAEAVEQLYGDGIGPHLFDLARHWAVAVVDGDRQAVCGCACRVRVSGLTPQPTRS